MNTLWWNFNVHKLQHKHQIKSMCFLGGHKVKIYDLGHKI
jgi:hypothetical protein